jgi:sugar O-acyltransferase (sialic acid O-acetyltransferase NeuD family)
MTISSPPRKQIEPALEEIFIYGAGGQAKIILDCLRNARQSYGVVTLVDDNEARHGESLLGHRIRSKDAIGAERGFIAIGGNKDRLRVAAAFKGKLVTLIHRTATISEETSIGEGTLLMAGSIVNIGTRIGDNVIINTAATVDHDCVIHDGVHIAPGCHLCGNVEVGSGTLLGVGTVVVPGIRIGRNARIHAGQAITRDVADGETVSHTRS